MDREQSQRLRHLRNLRDQLIQKITEVNTEIDKMMDGSVTERPVDVPWIDLGGYLCELHLQAGSPSSRSIAKSTGSIVSHTTVSEALRGNRIPSWKTLWPIAQVLGADENVLKEIWHRSHTQPPKDETI